MKKTRFAARPFIKTVLPISAALVVATALIAGCSSSSKSAASSSSAVSSSSPAASSSAPSAASQIGNPTSAICDGKSYTIGFDAFTVTAPGTSIFLSSMKDLATKLGCVKIISTVNNVDPATALQNARTFVTQKVDAVILFSAITATATGELSVLQAAKIPVVQFGAVAPGSPSLLAPELDAGTLAGTQLAKAFLAANTGKAPYVIAGRNSASGQPYIGYMDNFIKGATSTIPAFPAANTISLETTTDTVKAQSVTRDALSKIPPTSPVLLMGNDQAVSAAMLQTVLQQNGRIGGVYAIDGRGSVAGDKAAICAAPQWVGMVDYQFETWASYTVPLAILQAQGKTVPDSNTTQVKYISHADLCV